jgi:hypothetical protein
MKWLRRQGQIGSVRPALRMCAPGGGGRGGRGELSQSTIRAQWRRRGSVGGLHSERRSLTLGRARGGLAAVFAVTAFGQLFSASLDTVLQTVALVTGAGAWVGRAAAALFA